MGKLIVRNNKVLFRMLDFSILVISFLIAFEQFKNAVLLDINIYALTLAYASIAFVLVRFSKSLASKMLNSSSDILKMACGNACGLVGSIILFSAVAYLVPSMSDILPLAIISSLASFFIMGTVVPAIKRIIEVKAKQASFRAAL